MPRAECFFAGRGVYRMSDLKPFISIDDTIEESTAPPSEGVKERLMAAAIDLFCEKGYHATSVREIVERAGVTKPVLYYYFKNKDGLFTSLIEETMAKFRRDLHEACEQEVDCFADRLHRIRGAFLDGVATNPQLVRFMDAVTFSGQFEELFDLQSDWQQNFLRIVGVFREARERGEIGAAFGPEPAAQAFVGMVVNQMRMRVYMPEAMTEEPDLVDILLKGIEARK